MNKTIAIIKKYVDYLVTKVKVLKNQKTFRYENVQVHFMFKPNPGAKTLAVLFSACTREGVTARYNYVGTMEGVPCHQLFILDDFGPDRRGSFYLGRYPEYKEEKATLALIQHFLEELKPQTLLFCGSCKGGYAAVNFGCRFTDSVIITGEPAYKNATEFAKVDPLLQYWMQPVNEENFRLVDDHLKNTLIENRGKTKKIFYFYSTVDEYINRHTKPFLADLQKYEYPLETQVMEYEKHADLSLYFPMYLKEKVTMYV